MIDLSSLNTRNTLVYLSISFILLTNFLLGYAITYKNYNIIFFLVSIFLVTIILKSNIITVSIILFIIPFTAWAVEYALIPPQVMWLPELLSGLIFMKALISKAFRKQRFNLFGIHIIVGFLIITFISLIYNSSSFISELLFLRLILRYYLLFLAIINLDFEEKSMKTIINVLIFIFLVQIPLAVIKLFIYGPGETSFGLNSHSVSAYFPLIAIAFLFSFYFIYKNKPVYVLFSLGFVGFSIIGMKRAFLFFLPIVLLYIGWILKKDFKITFKFLLLTTLIVIISLYFISRLIPTLNPQKTVWGDFNLKHLINYAYNYTTHSTASGIPTGRVSTTLSVFNRLSNRGLYELSFGFGPGCIVKSIFADYDKRSELRNRF